MGRAGISGEGVVVVGAGAPPLQEAGVNNAFFKGEVEVGGHL